jgi:hypothetical protein
VGEHTPVARGEVVPLRERGRGDALDRIHPAVEVVGDDEVAIRVDQKARGKESVLVAGWLSPVYVLPPVPATVTMMPLDVATPVPAIVVMIPVKWSTLRTRLLLEPV